MTNNLRLKFMEKLHVIQENSEIQFNELRNKINKQNEYFTKAMETIKIKNSGAEKLNKRDEE